ncbi:MAG: hypothetical protein ACQEV0_10175 [Bacillota bacterium]
MTDKLNDILQRISKDKGSNDSKGNSSTTRPVFPTKKVNETTIPEFKTLKQYFTNLNKNKTDNKF